MSIGLKRGTVKLSEYSDDWPNEYEKESLLIMTLAGKYISRIEHIGSTSVPGLNAKPIIDISIEVDSKAQLEMLVKSLPSDIYEYFGERDIPGDYFFAKGSEAMRTHYIHVSLRASNRLDNYIKFRDALRSNPILASEYRNLKERLSNQYQNDRKSYTELKGQLIAEVINS
ncbi:GrpB family protein [Celerinatantimonas diazotrophica]|uniref:GrpB-like predicted nucleotidyltransferase (UPF0157 family) n=1 Tax=Celerinatantimonas diazotrophica TaxID=412034 RepID=A0A4R1J9R3_9GAMM|nr:GrpB family protein [Celerinatantimonas diazotrophica]TCK47177.1 GrpB-like predicted nucleotidyltransferase (UPF0157 family) [Celerinatantimonas diazotrophica]CAG9295949.1 hypothetical protein CEDIAZO_01083 [Celerinatantimonas diazotrophica]